MSDGLVLVVPRSGAELQAWGRRFANCVGSYSAAVEAGRSHIVGVELHEVLSYCLEIKPDRTIRQFLGYRNRAVPREHATVVARYLMSRGALDAGNAANRVWL
ncbi:MAG: PcfJ domain-containing protein [Acidimicrobiales bacterium]